MGIRPDQAGGELGAAAAAAKGKRRREEVKVTHIVTARVSADEASFRDVVQRLTGKDSAAARAAAVAGSAGNGRLLLVGGDAAGVLPSSEEKMKRCVPVDEEGKGIAGGAAAAANQAGRRAISAAWVIDGDTHCPVFLPRRRPVPPGLFVVVAVRHS
uniref:VQ domain-containing protein n=1 Tax=Oryza longistaminata TaxID=4528 RepID=A0A1V1H724_ORYLO|nr:hypothetical protein [Oryza longistaminata]